jgi:hypothetical protein
MITKQKKLVMSMRDVICPISMTKRYEEIYKKVDYYIRNRLSLDFILKQFDDLDKTKSYVFSSNELFIIENYDRVTNRILNYKVKEKFDIERFKNVYQEVSRNAKFMDILK